MSDEGEPGSNDKSIATSRTKRRKVDKTGKLAAFERLKSAKASGSKNKWVDETSSKVYDVVDEVEYTKIVRERADDWIVDDDGNGYVEDGREIFDDESEEEYEDKKNSHNKRKSSSKTSKLKDAEPVNKKASVRNFFSKAEPKKKDTTASVDDDNILSNLLGELDGGKSNVAEPVIKPAKIVKSFKKVDESEDEVKKYMEKFGKGLKRNKNEEKEKQMGDEMLKQILHQDDKKTRQETSKKSSTSTESQKPSQVIEIEPDSESTSTATERNETPKENDTPAAETDALNESIRDDLNSLQTTDFDDDDFTIETTTPAADKAKLTLKKPEPVRLTEKPMNESAILKELEGIDFNQEIEMEAGKNSDQLDLNTDTMSFYYWDAWNDPIKRPGEIFLFGKVEVPGKNKNSPEYKSVCVHVENVDKCLYLLPRTHIYDLKRKEQTDKEVTLTDVYKEFTEKISIELNINVHRTRKVVKNFVFQIPNVDVPIECEYLEVRYSGKLPAPNLKKEYSTIAHIFGTNTTPIETFLLERKIKGPNWLEVKKFKVIDTPFSWTKLQISCPDMNCIKIKENGGPPPPLVVCGLNVKSVLNEKSTRNEIVMISCLVNDSYSVEKSNPHLVSRQFCGVTRPSNKNWPFDANQKIQQYKKFKIFKFDNERALLTWFLSIYQNIDPDIVVTHDSYDCQLDIICNRLTFFKIPLWSRIGRLRMSQPHSKRIDEFLIGRMVCDVKISAQELIKSRSYDLKTLCDEILKVNDRQEILFDNIPYAYADSSSILELIEINVQDCLYIMKLMSELNILPLALQITSIAGNLMSRTLQGGRSERNEFLLLHAFHEKDYIVPDRQLFNRDAHLSETQHDKTTDKKKKAAYTGGLVLDPIKGFYTTYILLMDFNSLYPSIIQEYNICYTTITPPSNPEELPVVPDPGVELGILPRQIRRLVESRRNVKNLMAKPNLAADLKMQYNIRQMALKLTANSMYGCLGFSKSRFYAPHLAALVTHKGRDILMNTKTLAQKLNHVVIYGDTDSIMINTNSMDYEEVYKIGSNIKQAVNKVYRHVELDIDGVFRFLLLLKKKKYAAVTVQQKNGKLEYAQELKGLDIVRRDWSKIASNTGKLVLDKLLTDGKEMDERLDEIYNILEELRDDLLAGKIPLPLLVITKQLTRAPNEYDDYNSLPHVQVALRMNINKNRRFKKGDMIDYIICLDGTENPAVKRGYHIDEIKNSEILKVDTTYYLSQQIHPVISRLLEPIEGIDSALIALKLGLDSSRFRHSTKANDEVNEGESLIKSNTQKYRYCEKFKFKCVACKSQNFVAAAFKRENNKFVSIFEKCMNSDCNVAPYKYAASISNQLRITIHENIQRFSENLYVCDNPLCNKITGNQIWIMTDYKTFTCLYCRSGNLTRLYTETELNTQLSYYKYMFDLQKYDMRTIKLIPEIKNAYEMCYRTVESFVSNSAFFHVSLANLYYNYNIRDENEDDQKAIKKEIKWTQFYC